MNGSLKMLLGKYSFALEVFRHDLIPVTDRSFKG